MTKVQKKIVIAWFLVLLLLATFMIFDNWISEHWSTLMWPSFAVILILFALSKKDPAQARKEGILDANRIIEENLWIKIYYAIYGMIVVIGASYIVLNNIDVGDMVFKGAFITIILVVLPIKIIQSKEAYIKAGK